MAKRKIYKQPIFEADIEHFDKTFRIVSSEYAIDLTNQERNPIFDKMQEMKIISFPFSMKYRDKTKQGTVSIKKFIIVQDTSGVEYMVQNLFYDNDYKEEK